MTEFVNFTWTTTRSPAEVRDWVSSSVVDVLRRAGYRVRADTPEELVMTRRGPDSRKLLFFSLAAALYSTRRSSSVVFKFFTTAAGLTQMMVIGELPRRVASALNGLPQSQQ